ncbi:hypothetical protein PVK06_002111 [Gossypium arboreum]|uniref:Uncharacterized protein n=1 Tax=Gossypium arboreum TaxID=29729 RepID=A0ABR0R314_GOSAR|nr:hypothetical protein PVK06_002111 [Gossypium arboreum]
MKKENEVINKKNEDLSKHLRVAEVKVGLSRKVAAEREVARMKHDQFEALEKIKEENSRNMCNSISKLKMNILLNTQVTNGHFNAIRVDFNALYDVDIGVLRFDVCFPSSDAWDLFVSTWRNS